jgi:hypothetical protein
LGVLVESELSAALFLLRCRSQKMTIAQTQRRARQPNVPPIIAPVLLGLLLLVLEEDVVLVWLLGSVDDPGPGGAVLLGGVVSVEVWDVCEGVSVGRGPVEAVFRVLLGGNGEGVGVSGDDGFALVVKAKY